MSPQARGVIRTDRGCTDETTDVGTENSKEHSHDGGGCSDVRSHGGGDESERRSTGQKPVERELMEWRILQDFAGHPVGISGYAPALRVVGVAWAAR